MLGFTAMRSGGGRCMSVGFAMLIFFGLAVMGLVMVFTMSLVHAFMQPLGGLPGMLVTGRSGKDQGSGSKKGWNVFHERGNRDRCQTRDTSAPCNQLLCRMVRLQLSVWFLPIASPDSLPTFPYP